MDEKRGRPSFSNIVGSIKGGVGRVASLRKKSDDATRSTSPIPIPKQTAAPTLSANLLPQGFSPTLEFVPSDSVAERFRRLQDPQNSACNIPVEPTPLVTIAMATTVEGSPSMHNSPACPKLTLTGLDFDTLLPGPPTPLPGTNAEMELDGCSNDLPVFERSVETPKGSAKGKIIRHLRSIDALASDTNATAVRSSPQLAVTSLKRPSARRLASISTVQTIPSDMQVLSRQANPQLQPEPSPLDIESGHSNGTPSSTDVQDPSNTSPLLTGLKQALGLERNERQVLGVPLLGEEVWLPIRTRADSPLRGPSTPPRSTCIMLEKMPTASDTSTTDDNCKIPTAVWPRGSNQNVKALEAEDAESIITNYDEFKTQHLFGGDDDFEFPEYDNAFHTPDRPLNQSTDGELGILDFGKLDEIHLTDGSPYSARSQSGKSPRRWRSVPMHELYEPANRSCEESIRATDVGSVFWRFDGNGSGREATINDPRAHGVSVNTTAVNYAKDMESSNSESTSFKNLMGSRIDFELNRSERNMRYNALDIGLELLDDASERHPSADYKFGRLNQHLRTPSGISYANAIRYGSESDSAALFGSRGPTPEPAKSPLNPVVRFQRDTINDSSGSSNQAHLTSMVGTHRGHSSGASSMTNSLSMGENEAAIALAGIMFGESLT